MYCHFCLREVEEPGHTVPCPHCHSGRLHKTVDAKVCTCCGTIIRQPALPVLAEPPIVVDSEDEAEIAEILATALPEMINPVVERRHK